MAAAPCQNSTALKVQTLCAPVSVKHSNSGKGQVTIRYTSLDELDGLLERFKR